MIFQRPYLQAVADKSSGINRMESRMLDLPQEECPVIHRFGPGIYIREVTLPAGAFVVGHKQTHEHLNIMLKGKVRMEDGTLLEAPLTFVGKPGRKCGTVLDEVIWQNVYATTETDIETLEATYLEKSETFKNHLTPRSGVAEAREDFQKMLLDLGVSHQTITDQSKDESDQTQMPLGSYKFQLAPSEIHGRGVFACGDIAQAEIIGAARLGAMRTPLGRYTNHSGVPNARMVAREERIDLVALHPIRGNQGGQLGDEITVDYRVSVEAACQA